MTLFKYWKELLFFGIISSVYIICTNPGASWFGLGCDIWDFLYAGRFVVPPHFPGFPVYALLNSAASQLSRLGVDNAWISALLLSTIPAIATCFLVFLIVRRLTNNEWSPYVSSISLAGSNAFLVQSTIPEVYSFSIFMLVLTFCMLIYKKYNWMAIFAGLCVGVHPFVLPAIFAMWIYDAEFRKKWYLYVPFGLIPYLFLLFPNNELNFSINSVGASSYIMGALNENMRYWGGDSITNIPQKLLDVIAILTTSFGLTLIPMIYYLKDWKRSGLLIACAIVPFVYGITCIVMSSQHLIISYPFLAVAAGLGLSKIKIKPIFIFGFSLILLIILPLKFDVGNTVDKELSAQNMYEQISKIPDNSMVATYCRTPEGKIAVGGREQVGIWYYNEIENKSIVTLNLYNYLNDIPTEGETVGSQYRSWLSSKYSIDTPVVYSITEPEQPGHSIKNWGEMCMDNLQSIKKANPDRKIYITEMMDTKEYSLSRRLYEIK